MKFVKTITILLFSVIFCLNSIGFAEYSSNDFRVYVVMDKFNFYSDEEINLKVCVKNISGSKKDFFVYDKNGEENINYSTFQPVVMDMDGREAEIIVPYRMEYKSKSDESLSLTRRGVELLPEETLIHSVNLKKIYSLDHKKKYRVKGFFFPDFKEDQVITSNNEVTFYISSARSDSIKSGIRFSSRKEKIYRDISPSEIISLALISEKGKEWDKMIKYIDIEQYINAYSDYARRYNISEEYDEKLKIEKDFIRFITRDRDDYILDFKVISENIKNDNKIAYVDVIVDRNGIKRTNRYKYRYTLEKYGNMWLIVNLEATVLKGKRL